tara:strand:- start:1689 stop:1811 length:123 start_codon:yes stop_codon:yes gene_type:complete
MMRFLSGFFLGYMVAKRPPTEKELRGMADDVLSLFRSWTD